MKKTLASLAVAGLVIGGAAAAYAATVGGDPAARAQARACVDKARSEHGDDHAAKREAVATCLTDAGVTPLGIGPVPRAVRGQIKALPEDRRDALIDCMKKAHDAHPTDRPALREAAKACLGQAGITVPTPTPEDRAQRQKVKACVAQARKDHPGVPRTELRDAVKQCVATK